MTLAPSPAEAGDFFDDTANVRPTNLRVVRGLGGTGSHRGFHAVGRGSDGMPIEANFELSPQEQMAVSLRGQVTPGEISL